MLHKLSTKAKDLLSRKSSLSNDPSTTESPYASLFNDLGSHTTSSVPRKLWKRITKHLTFRRSAYCGSTSRSSSSSSIRSPCIDIARLRETKHEALPPWSYLLESIEDKAWLMYQSLHAPPLEKPVPRREANDASHEAPGSREPSKLNHRVTDCKVPSIRVSLEPPAPPSPGGSPSSLATIPSTNSSSANASPSPSLAAPPRPSDSIDSARAASELFFRLARQLQDRLPTTRHPQPINLAPPLLAQLANFSDTSSTHTIATPNGIPVPRPRRQRLQTASTTQPRLRRVDTRSSERHRLSVTRPNPTPEASVNSGTSERAFSSTGLLSNSPSGSPPPLRVPRRRTRVIFDRRHSSRARLSSSGGNLGAISHTVQQQSFSGTITMERDTSWATTINGSPTAIFRARTRTMAVEQEHVSTSVPVRTVRRRLSTISPRLPEQIVPMRTSNTLNTTTEEPSHPAEVNLPPPSSPPLSTQPSNAIITHQHISSLGIVRGDATRDVAPLPEPHRNWDSMSSKVSTLNMSWVRRGTPVSVEMPPSVPPRASSRGMARSVVASAGRSAQAGLGRDAMTEKGSMGQAAPPWSDASRRQPPNATTQQSGFEWGEHSSTISYLSPSFGTRALPKDRQADRRPSTPTPTPSSRHNTRPHPLRRDTFGSDIPMVRSSSPSTDTLEDACYHHQTGHKRGASGAEADDVFFNHAPPSSHSQMSDWLGAHGASSADYASLYPKDPTSGEGSDAAAAQLLTTSSYPQSAPLEILPNSGIRFQPQQQHTPQIPPPPATIHPSISPSLLLSKSEPATPQQEVFTNGLANIPLDPLPWQAHPYPFGHRPFPPLAAHFAQRTKQRARDLTPDRDFDQFAREVETGRSNHFVNFGHVNSDGEDGDGEDGEELSEPALPRDVWENLQTHMYGWGQYYGELVEERDCLVQREEMLEQELRRLDVEMVELEREIAVEDEIQKALYDQAMNTGVDADGIIAKAERAVLDDEVVEPITVSQCEVPESVYGGYGDDDEAGTLTIHDRSQEVLESTTKENMSTAVKAATTAARRTASGNATHPVGVHSEPSELRTQSRFLQLL